jgi:hypothetical protein
MTSRKDNGNKGTTATLPSREHLSGRELVVAAALAVVSFTLYIPSFSNNFVDYDDHHYVTSNKVVQKGITREGFVWAFTTTKFANWLPVTWLSHELDCELYGLNAGGHHASSALLHALNAVFLFFALRAMTWRFWEPAAVAALFAVHPLRVESVAWVAERKDVLCGTFFMLALLAYAGYSRRPTAGRYLLVVLCHALGLMSKTMLVTLPCLLLLLDFWPLRRWRPGGTGSDDAGEFPARRVGWLVLEKVPLVVLSIVSSAWTVFFQSSGGAMWGYRDLTLGQRAANAVVSVPRYLVKIAWPANLSVFYPHPGSWPAWQVAVAGALILALSAGAAMEYRHRPYVTVGWFWFLGMLMPVIGIIQVGLQSMADRYTYLPGIGLTVAVVWWTGDMLRAPRSVNSAVVAGRIASALVLVVVLGVFSAQTIRMQFYWKDTLTLFNHALEVDPDNWLANNMVGSVYATNGEMAFNRGDAAATKRFYEIAADHLYRSVQLNPNHYLTFHNYAWSLYRLGRLEEAAENFRRSMQVDPEFGFSELYLALTLANRDRLDEAMPHFEAAGRRLPKYPDAHFHWAEALLKQGKKDEAIAQLNETLRLDPNHSGAKYWLEQATKPSTAPTTGPSTAPATAPATQSGK